MKLPTFTQEQNLRVEKLKMVARDGIGNFIDREIFKFYELSLQNGAVIARF